jgi:hypothetical protein
VACLVSEKASRHASYCFAAGSDRQSTRSEPWISSSVSAVASDCHMRPWAYQSIVRSARRGANPTYMVVTSMVVTTMFVSRHDPDIGSVRLPRSEVRVAWLPERCPVTRHPAAIRRRTGYFGRKSRRHLRRPYEITTVVTLIRGRRVSRRLPPARRRGGRVGISWLDCQTATLLGESPTTLKSTTASSISLLLISTTFRPPATFETAKASMFGGAAL